MEERPAYETYKSKDDRTFIRVVKAFDIKGNKVYETRPAELG